MNPRCTAKRRRWQSSIAIACIAGALVALVAGSALRTEFTASSLPEPVAWTQTVHHGVDVHAHFSRDATSNTAKPFRNVWMTHDRPAKRAMPTTSTDRLLPSKSVATGRFRAGVDGRSPATFVPVSRNLLTLNCVDRC